MRIPEEIINEIKYRNNIDDVISPYVNLKRRGKNLVGLCPFHGEKTPSFTVYPENGSFYCFGCGVGGDVFTFIKLIENLDYVESIKLLAEKSGVAIPENGYDDSFSKLKNTIYEINRETAKFYHNYLMSDAGKWALDYLTGRGLSIQTIKHFGLGAAPDGWDSLLKHLSSLGFSYADMIQANVIGKSQKGSYYDRFRRRVMYPIINIRGKIVAFSGRKMEDDTTSSGKYVNTSDTPVYKKSENLFGMNFAKNHGDERIILVEGNMDVISLHQAGFQNAVAACGTAFTPEQVNLICRYTNEIILTFDSDNAGKKAVARAEELLKNTGLNIKVLTVPDAKDPDEYIKKFGAIKFKALIENAVSMTEYNLLSAANGVNLLSDEGKLKYLSNATSVIAKNPNIMERDYYIGKLSDKFGISRTALEAKVKELRRSERKKIIKREFDEISRPKFDKSSVNPEKRLYPAAVNAEEAVIAVLMQHGDLIEHSLQSIKSDEMLSSLNRRIYAKIGEFYNMGRNIDISAFGDILSTAEMGYLTALANSEKAEKNPRNVLDDSISVIKLQRQKKDIKSVDDMSVGDWADNLKKMIENKQKGN